MRRYFIGLALLGSLLAGTLAWALDNAPVYLRASEILVEQGSELLADDQYGEARVFFEQALVANPKNALAHIGLGRVHRGLGNVTTGLRYFTVALELEPTNLEALEHQALTYLDRDSVADAEQNLTRIRRICGNNDCETSVRLAAAISAFLSEKLAVDSPEADDNGT